MELNLVQNDEVVKMRGDKEEIPNEEGPTDLPTLPKTILKPNKEYDGPSWDEIYQKRKKYMHPSLFHNYAKPLMIVNGKMQYVWDEAGKRYLDCFGGVCTISVGHCHPKVVQAGIEQLQSFQHGSQLYMHEQVALYSEEIVQRMPEESKLDTVFFVNSGSEANDLVLHMMRTYTGCFNVFSLRNGYHGMSTGVMGVTCFPGWRHDVPQGFGIHHAINPDPYRGVFGDDTQKYVDVLEDMIRAEAPCVGGKRSIAGMFCEAGIQGLGGSLVMSEGYLKMACDMVHKYGGLFCADEVQTGFGRTGDEYWSFVHEGIVPDFVVLGKGIGNGAPLAAVVTRREIADSMAHTGFFNSYGGNAFVCAIGRAVLKAIDEDHLQENSLHRGEQFLDGLKILQQKYRLVGDVRGRGLMLGMELVKDRETKAPAIEETAKFLDECRDMGLLVGKGGLGCTIRIKPPMCITEDDVEFTLEVFDRALENITRAKDSLQALERRTSRYPLPT